MVGSLSTKGVPRYMSFALPALTDLPWGKLRSIMTLLVVEFDFSLVMKGEVCKLFRGGGQKGLKWHCIQFLSSYRPEPPGGNFLQRYGYLSDFLI